jgi:hypothetical protein
MFHLLFLLLEQHLQLFQNYQKKLFRITGTKLDTAEDIVFIASPSTEVVIEVCIDNIPRKIVKQIPIIHILVLLNILLKLESPILLFKLFIIENAIDKVKNGTTKVEIIYPTKLHIKSNKGFIKEIVVIDPVAIKTPVKKGDMICIKLVNVVIVDLNISITTTKVLSKILDNSKKVTKLHIFIILLSLSNSKFLIIDIITKIIIMLTLLFKTIFISLKNIFNI